MNLVLQLMTGVTLAGLAEGMALADRAGLQQKDVLEVLELTSMACPTLIDKGRGECPYLPSIIFHTVCVENCKCKIMIKAYCHVFPKVFNNCLDVL